jgi:hypothetical protein
MDVVVLYGTPLVEDPDRIGQVPSATRPAGSP